MVATRSKRRPNTWTKKVRRSLIFFTSVLVHCKGQRARNKSSDLRRKGRSQACSSRFDSKLMVSVSKFLYTRMQPPPLHAYLLNVQIKRAKNVGFGDQTDDAKGNKKMKI